MMKKELDFKVKEMVLADLGRSARALIEKFQGVECTTENKEWAFDYLANQLIELTEMYERVYNDSEVAEVVEVAEVAEVAETMVLGRVNTGSAIHVINEWVSVDGVKGKSVQCGSAHTYKQQKISVYPRFKVTAKNITCKKCLKAFLNKI
jgi:hypothetical protein